MNRFRSGLIYAVLYGLSWKLLDEVVVRAFSDSSARLAYGEIAGFWAALYLGFVFDAIDIRKAPLMYVFSIPICYVLGSLDFASSNYHDISPWSVEMILFSLPRALLLCVPLVINSGCAALKRRIHSKRSIKSGDTGLPAQAIN